MGKPGSGAVAPHQPPEAIAQGKDDEQADAGDDHRIDEAARRSVPGSAAPDEPEVLAGGDQEPEHAAGEEKGDDHGYRPAVALPDPLVDRSEEHTSELQSLRHLVCRLL